MSITILIVNNNLISILLQGLLILPVNTLRQLRVTPAFIVLCELFGQFVGLALAWCNCTKAIVIILAVAANSNFCIGFSTLLRRTWPRPTVVRINQISSCCSCDRDTVNRCRYCQIPTSFWMSMASIQIYLGGGMNDEAAEGLLHPGGRQTPSMGGDRTHCKTTIHQSLIILQSRRLVHCSTQGGGWYGRGNLSRSFLKPAPMEDGSLEHPRLFKNFTCNFGFT